MENIFTLLWVIISLNLPLHVYAILKTVRAGGRTQVKLWLRQIKNLVGNLFIFVPYMKFRERLAFIGFFVGSVLALWTQVQANTFFAGVADEGLVKHDLRLALVNIAWLGLFQLLTLALGMLTNRLSLWSIHRASEVQRLGYVEEQKNLRTRAASQAEHESRKVTDPEELRDSYLEMLSAFQAIISLLEVIATIIVLSKSLLGTLIVFPSVLCLLALRSLLAKRSQRLEHNRSVTSQLDRALRRLALVPLDALMRSGYTGPFMKKLRRDFSAYRKNVLYANDVANLLAGLLTFSQRVIAPAGLLFIVVLNPASLGTIIALMAQVERIGDPLTEIVKGLLAYQQLLVNKGRLNKVTRDAKRLPVVKNPLPIPLGKMLRLENVSFSTTDPAGVVRQLLINITMSMTRGNIYLFCGPANTGKKTLAGSVIPAFRSFVGKITLDGISVKEYVAQIFAISHGEAAYPYLNGDGTIADLLRFGMPGATTRQILTVLAQVFWLQCVRRLPKGIHTLLVDMGKFSKADKRMLDFGRVLAQLTYMKAAAAILLDPFRDVPLEQRPYILNIIEEMRKKQKIVIIASDKVVRPLPHWQICFFPLNGGVKVGTFSEMMKDAEFSSWWGNQSSEDWSSYDKQTVARALQRQFVKGGNDQQLPAVAALPWHGGLKATVTAKLADLTSNTPATPVQAQQPQTPAANPARVLLPHEIKPKQVQVTGILQTLPPVQMSKRARVLLPHER